MIKRLGAHRALIQTLNEMIDNHGKRPTALRKRVPNIVLLSLFGLATIAGGFTGYGSGLDARRTRLPVHIMGLLISVVILLILDPDRQPTTDDRYDSQYRFFL